MHRMRLLAIPTSLVAVAAAAALGIAVPTVTHATGNVVVSSVTEPPDSRPTRGHWRTTVTVSNQSHRQSSPVRLRMFLSRGRRVTATIPASIPERSYYVVTCLGTARVGTDTLQCHFSGQTMRVGAAAPSE